MLLYSLPSSYENFRCAIESRDELPSPETLRIKIIEESDARKNDTNTVQNAMIVNKTAHKRRNPNKNKAEPTESKERFKFQCHQCRKFGHKTVDCKSTNKKSKQTAKNVEDISLLISEKPSRENTVLAATNQNYEAIWCLDSGVTSHLCKKLQDFTEIHISKNGTLNLATLQRR